MRKELTDEWQKRGITKDKDYAILIDEMTKAWSGLSIKEYKELKDLKKENLRDNMTNIELDLNMLAEATTTNISVSRQPSTFDQNKRIAWEGGEVAGIAKAEFEKRTGKKAVSPINAKDKKLLEVREETLPKGQSTPEKSIDVITKEQLKKLKRQKTKMLDEYYSSKKMIVLRGFGLINKKNPLFISIPKPLFN